MKVLPVALATCAFALGALAGAYIAVVATSSREKPAPVSEVRLDPIPEWQRHLLELQA